MQSRTRVVSCLAALVIGAAVFGCASAAPRQSKPAPRMEKRWLFVWQDMSDPKQIDRMIARFPRAHKDGYNGVVFNWNVAPSKAAELRAAAKQYGLDLYPTVMGGSRDPNMTEGVLSKDALFIAKDGVATFHPDNPTVVKNGDFEDVTGDHFNDWQLQDDEGVTTFADHTVVHGGRTSLRMESIGKNQYQHCRLAQPIRLQPHRQYLISVWVKSEGLRGVSPEIKVLGPDSEGGVSFGTFHTNPTQGWKLAEIVFNSGKFTDAMLYLGSWSGKEGTVWWDDLKVEEIGLVNVVRRKGCPVTVRGENGTTYEEGRDYEKIVDPNLRIYQPYHPGPAIKLTANTRIKDGERLRVSYYHPVIIYEDRLTTCLSEPAVFTEWEAQVRKTDQLLHPKGFFMSHDELRVINQCALCQSRHMTPGQILADNVRKSIAIIRKVRPDAEIYVWNDMFDPMHNAKKSGYYLVNGSLEGSWKGLDKGVTIVNWNGGLLGKNSPFFAKLGLKQILSGYYDGDEDGSAIAKWEEATKDVPGIIGAMYTTWEDKYDAMDVWAQKAWGGASGAESGERR